MSVIGDDVYRAAVIAMSGISDDGRSDPTSSADRRRGNYRRRRNWSRIDRRCIDYACWRAVNNRRLNHRVLIDHCRRVDRLLDDLLNNHRRRCLHRCRCLLLGW